MKMFSFISMFYVLFLMPSVAFRVTAQEISVNSDEYISESYDMQSTNLNLNKLDNGLTVYSYKTTSDKPVIRVILKAGYASEANSNKTALAFIESIIKTELGQNISSKVGSEYTYFDIQLNDNNSESLKKNIQLVRTLISNLKINESSLETARLELLSDINDPNSPCRNDESFCKALFAGSKYSRDLKDCLSGIQNMTVSNLNKFYNDNFQTQNMAIALISNLDANQVYSIVNREMASLVNKSESVNSNIKPLKMNDEVKTYVRYNAESNNATIYLKHLNYKMGSYKGYATDLSFKLLSIMLNNRLNTNSEFASVEEAHLCNNQNAIKINFSVSDNNPDNEIEKASKSLSSIYTQVFTDSEFNKAIQELQKIENAKLTNDSPELLLNDITLNFAKEFPIYDNKTQISLNKSLLTQIKVNNINDLARETVNCSNTVISINSTKSEKVFDSDKITEKYTSIIESAIENTKNSAYNGL